MMQAHGRVGTQDMRSLCSAVLQYLASPVLGQMPRVCSATELRDHISACRPCECHQSHICHPGIGIITALQVHCS